MKKVQKMILSVAAITLLLSLGSCLTTVVVGRDRRIDPPDYRDHPDDHRGDRPGDHQDGPPPRH